MNGLAVILLCIVPVESTAVETVDSAELNHYFNGQGGIIFDQIIFRHHGEIVAWRLIKTPGQGPRRDWLAGGYVTTWNDGDKLRQVRVQSYFETWTQDCCEGDREINEREHLPQERRRQLMSARKK